jgi:protocatechuate 3,4-dioxygenase alpha subunit
MSLIVTGSQTAGPYFRFGLDHPEWEDMTDGGKAKGEIIEIEGVVYDGDGVPVPDSMIELWQANADGKYHHPDDTQDKPVDPHFRGFGRCCSDTGGRFHFVTVKPGPVPGRGNALQAPHIEVTVFARGVLHHLTTRIYFPDEALNKTDAVLASVEDPEARQTLFAVPQGETASGRRYRFDIRLQGEGETQFFIV